MSALRHLSPLLAALLLSACATFGTPGGFGLQPGVHSLAEVEARLGPPSLRWRNADGSEQLAYPQGPAGLQTWMVHGDPSGRLLRLENVLDSSHFSLIRPGEDDHESVLRRLGPPAPGYSVLYEARNELAWEWRFCDDWSRLARLDVLFDATTGKVRAVQQRRELYGPRLESPWCSR
ncbi:hypothetical protein VX159_14115 [Dechloromonas sp. ZY10]|uniref:hypothetical protein n=1 Tax=Dechloromonas aquae TaxID=2664436 RepID=UPI00352938A5